MKSPRISPALHTGLAGLKSYLLWAGVFSLGINVLTLSIPLYSIQLFDRVLSSGSGATLAVLTVAVMGGLLSAALIEDVRARLLIALGIRFDSQLATRLFTHQLERAGQGERRGEVVRDLDNVRQVLTGSGIIALFDLPWAPLFVGVCFYLHPWLGMLTLGGAVMVLCLAVLNQWLVAVPLSESARKADESYRLTDGALSNAETVRALGMLPDIVRRWSAIRDQAIASQADASSRNASISSFIKFLRYALQVSILGTGAWLAVGREISPGALFAASIISTRALLPIDQLVVAWRQLLSGRAALGRVDEMLKSEVASSSFKLPEPSGRLTVEGLCYSVPGARAPTLQQVNFAVEPGEAVGVVGPSAAGKSTLARLIIGAIRPTEGAIRLDGAETWSWDREDFGGYAGYVSQSIELFEGTIAENIARFKDADSAAIVAAARLAGVHEMILLLPDGYETRLLPNGAPLSGGQRQRIALARAVFGNPRLVVLDEPNSNLDGEGDAALQMLLATLKKRGVTVILIAHRPSVLVSLDKVLVLRGGSVADFGTVEAVMPRIAPGFPVQAKRVAGGRP